MKFLKNRLSLVFAALIFFSASIGLISEERFHNLYNESWFKDSAISKELESLSLNNSSLGGEDGISPSLITTDPIEISKFIKKFNSLPENFITKADASALGWQTGDDLWEVEPNKSLGGNHFGNYEGLLPKSEGRTYLECDVNYTGGRRGNERLVYSNDGLFFLTEDHYRSFSEII